MTRSLPLIVDLDETLLRTDTLLEAIAHLASNRPAKLLVAIGALAKGRPAFKQAITEASDLDIAGLPARTDLVEWLRGEKSRGREIHLVTGADQAMADAVAAHFALFDSATGSGNGVNLKGRNKQAFLRQRFHDGYVYAGDNPADLHIWRDADGIVLAGVTDATRRKAKALQKPIEADFTHPPASPGLWVEALRLHHWTKNLLVFIPLILSGLYSEPSAIIAAVMAFVALGLVAAGGYVVNDLADLAADRAHRTKHTRALASGRLPLKYGFAAAPLLILAGLILAGLGGWQAFAAIGAYLAITLAYSFWLKRKAVVDVMVLAGLFTLRLLAGTVIIGAEVSFWLLSFAAFFFLSLSLAKRHTEIVNVPAGAALNGRGYTGDDAPFTLAAGLTSGMAALVILSLYIAEDATPLALYGEPALLWAAPVLIGAWMLRIWLLAHRGTLRDDPVSFAVSDRISIGLGAVLAIAFAGARFL